jgi:hypothetical protein
MAIMNGLKMKTPLGTGTLEGRILVIVNGCAVRNLLIRLPINKETEPHKRDANCLTRHANESGLWHFFDSEVKAEV